MGTLTESLQMSLVSFHKFGCLSQLATNTDINSAWYFISSTCLSPSCVACDVTCNFSKH